jgi:hypothetical protein
MIWSWNWEENKSVDAVEAEHLLVARTPHEYADAVVSVLCNPFRRAGLAQAGRRRIFERHTRANSMQRLDGLIERCLDQHSLKAADGGELV